MNVYKNLVGLSGIAGGVWGGVKAYQDPKIKTEKDVIIEVISHGLAGVFFASPFSPIACGVCFTKFDYNSNLIPREGGIEGHPYPED